MQLQRLLLTLFLQLLFINFSNASDYPRPDSISPGDYKKAVQYIESLANDLIDDEDLSSVSVALIDDQKVLMSKGIGFSDKDSEHLASENTVYRIGALSTVMTSALVLRLQELGLLNLDDAIKKYLPELTVEYSRPGKFKISIRNLLTHHSGLPMSHFQGSWSDKPESLQAFFQKHNRFTASYLPNQVYAYSNLGYTLLGVIIERVTKLSFSDAMNKYVFMPLDMQHSSVDFSSRVKKHLATGYKEEDEVPLLYPRDTPSLGVYSSVKDLTKFVQFIFSNGHNQNYLSEASLNVLLSVQNSHVELDLKKKLGLGWYISHMESDLSEPLIWRGGATLLYRSRVALLPERKLAVVLLANDSNAWKVLEKISDESLLALRSAKTGLPLPVVESEEETESKKIEVTKAELDKFDEQYSSFLGYLPLKRNEGSLSTELLGWNLLLNHHDDGWYTLEYDLLGFIPIDISWIANVKIKPEIIGDRKVIIASYKNQEYLFATGFPKMKVLKQWRSRLGTYEISNMDMLLKQMEVREGSLGIVNDQLVFTYELPTLIGLSLKIPLLIESPTRLRVPGTGSGLNEVIDVVKNNEAEILKFSGYHLRKVPEDTSVFDFEVF